MVMLPGPAPDPLQPGQALAQIMRIAVSQVAGSALPLQERGEEAGLDFCAHACRIPRTMGLPGEGLAVCLGGGGGRNPCLASLSLVYA